MRRSHHAGSSSATPTATPAQAGGDATSCKAGIPALQGREDVNASYGPSSWLSWDNFILDGWSLKIRSVLGPGWEQSFTDWPLSGTASPGGFSALPPLEPAIDVTECSSSELLPTPVAQDAGGTAKQHLHKKNRCDGAARTAITSLQVLMLPTPTARDEASTSGSNPAWGHGFPLTNAVRLLPTPMARDGDARTGGGHSAYQRMMSRQHGPNLPELLDYLSSSNSPMAPSETTALPSGDMQLF